jgi:hypothetical protein
VKTVLKVAHFAWIIKVIVAYFVNKVIIYKIIIACPNVMKICMFLRIQILVIIVAHSANRVLDHQKTSVYLALIIYTYI